MPQPSPTRQERDSDRWMQVVLHRRGHRWVFRWEPGGENDLIDRLTSLADDEASPLDWYDAAVLTHHVTRQAKASSPADSQSEPDPDDAA